MKVSHHSQHGSALVWTVLVIAILSLVAAELLKVVSGKYTNVMHAASWQESLLAAESGIDLAIGELRKTLTPQPQDAWQGWQSVLPQASPAPSATPFYKRLVKAEVPGSPMKIDVDVDAPDALRDPANSWRYYRIRTVGTMPINGPARANDNKQDTRLRKLSLRWDRLAQGAEAPTIDAAQVSRRIETIVRPVSAFDVAVLSVDALDLTNSGIIIDSYDSRDDAKSTRAGPDGVLGTTDDGTGNGPGLYDVAKRQQHGNIATNGQLINAGNAQIWGDVATNAGTVTGTANIKGIQRTDFYQTTRTIVAPSWPSINPSPNIITNNTALQATSTEGDSNSRFVVSSITLAGNDTLTLKGKPDGSPTYIEIYVTGNVDATGNAQLIVDPGVKAVMYFGGNVKFAGNGVANKNNQPGDLQMYGIKPPPGTTRNFELGGNAVLSAAVYAPEYDVQINNGGTRGSAYGSFVGKTVKMTGVTDLHYDEALSSAGLIANYKIVSWFEDTR